MRQLTVKRPLICGRLPYPVAIAFLSPPIGRKCCFGCYPLTSFLEGSEMGTLQIPMLLFVVCFSVSSTSSTGLLEENTSPEVGNTPSSFRQMLVRRLLHPNNFEDHFRETGPKRAHVRRFEQLPPGFLGVRGKKSEKNKAKNPVPGFLGVRGKKSTFNHLSDGLKNNIARYIQREFSKLK
ncbi:uncharacterized protein NPIL_122441 [Nephila pilipes]|uniref:Uncharacterized protein n=1 Tax=Nephila pilipes TaxID=299642 RepID=A0A8X6P2M2_NEPPI|nr:uncharacterized protein NPIL_122441 [Nephila pilipes]